MNHINTFQSIFGEWASLPRRAVFTVIPLIIYGHSVGAVAQADCEFNFENDYDIQDDFRCSGNCPKITTEFAREGTSSLRSYINRYNSKESYRTEITFQGGIDGRQKMVYNRDYWVGFSTLFPQNWKHSGTTEIVAQVHTTQEGGVPLAIRAGKGYWQVLSRGNRTKMTTYDLNSVYDDLGRWVDWVVRYKPSYRSEGVLKVWKDGELVVNQIGRPTAFKAEVGPYFKFGMYLSWRDRDCCDDMPPGKKVYHDALRIASGPNVKFRDVAPRNGIKAARNPDPRVDGVCTLTDD